MKKNILAIATLVALFSTNTLASQFCDGFEKGYITGWKQASGKYYDPYTPYCPYKPYKKYNDPDSDYERGYIIGLDKGMKKGRKD